MEDFVTIINEIVNKSNELKNTYTSFENAQVEFACIFCQSDDEYQTYTHEIEKQGMKVQETATGFTFHLNNPLSTIAGPLRFVKIRIPDPKRKELGDADFNTDYQNFKNKYKNNPHFELIKRENFEMLRLSDPNFNVMACFSDIPISKQLNSQHDSN